jgi:hypothetical protein
LSPPPDPVDSIFGVLNSVVFPNRSATTVAKGYTVEEPTMLMVSLADAAKVAGTAINRKTAADANTVHFFIFLSSLFACIKLQIKLHFQLDKPPSAFTS